MREYASVFALLIKLIKPFIHSVVFRVSNLPVTQHRHHHPLWGGNFNLSYPKSTFVNSSYSIFDSD